MLKCHMPPFARCRVNEYSRAWNALLRGKGMAPTPAAAPAGPQDRVEESKKAPVSEGGKVEKTVIVGESKKAVVGVGCAGESTSCDCTSAKFYHKMGLR